MNWTHSVCEEPFDGLVNNRQSGVLTFSPFLSLLRFLLAIKQRQLGLRYREAPSRSWPQLDLISGALAKAQGSRRLALAVNYVSGWIGPSSKKHPDYCAKPHLAAGVVQA